MNLGINLKRAFFPVGNAVVRKYKKNIYFDKALNTFAMGSAVGGISALVTKDPNTACVFAGLSLGSVSLAKTFAKKAKALESQFSQIIKRHCDIKLNK